MKKFLGVSLVAVLAVSPMMAQADVAPVSTNDTTVGVASTKYVKEAYNAMAAAVNSELSGKADSADLTGKANVGLDNLSSAGTTVITNNVKSNAAKGTYSASGTYDTGTIGKALQGKQDTISDLATIRSGAAKGASSVQSVAQGSANGTIAVDGTDVAVKGLGTAAYANTSAFDAAGAAGAVETKLGAGATGYDINAKTLKVQGTSVLTTGSSLDGSKITAGTVAKTALASGVQTSLDKADSAVQSVTASTSQMANGTINVDGTAVAVKGLGSAAYTASTAYDAAGAAAAVANKLDDGATGYDIDAKSLKVQGTSVLTTGSSLDGSKITAGTVAKTALATGVQTSLGKADTALQSDSALNGANLTAGTVAKTALASGVQTSLGKADTALQSNSALNGANLTTGSVPTAALADGAVTAAKLGAEIQLYSGWNSGGTPTANATTVALVAPVHGS